MNYSLKLIIIMMLIGSMVTNTVFANEDRTELVIDYENVMEEKDEKLFRTLTGSVLSKTGVAIYIATYDSKKNNKNSIDNINQEEYKYLNSVIIRYDSSSESYDISVGKKAAEILTSEKIDKIRDNDRLDADLKKSKPEGLYYLTQLVADEFYVANGFTSIMAIEEAKEKNIGVNKIFWIGLVALVILALAFTKISPYKKRKKLKKGESVYAPHTTNSEIFHQGISNDEKK